MLSCFSCVQFFVTPWTVACQASLSMQFSRQDYWSGLPFPCQGPWNTYAHQYFGIMVLIRPTARSCNLKCFRTSLVVGWIRNCLPMEGTWVRFLVQEDPTFHESTKLVSYNYSVCVLQLLKSLHLDPVFCNRSSPCNKPVQCRVGLPAATRESLSSNEWRSSATKKEKMLIKTHILYHFKNYFYNYTSIWLDFFAIMSILC